MKMRRIALFLIFLSVNLEFAAMLTCHECSGFDRCDEPDWTSKTCNDDFLDRKYVACKTTWRATGNKGYLKLYSRECISDAEKTDGCFSEGRNFIYCYCRTDLCNNALTVEGVNEIFTNISMCYQCVGLQCNDESKWKSPKQCYSGLSSPVACVTEFEHSKTNDARVVYRKCLSINIFNIPEGCYDYDDAINVDVKYRCICHTDLCNDHLELPANFSRKQKSVATKFIESTKETTPLVSQTTKKKSGLKCYFCDTGNVRCKVSTGWSVSECFVGEICMTYWMFRQDGFTVSVIRGCYPSDPMSECFTTVFDTGSLKQARCFCATSLCNNQYTPYGTSEPTKQIATKLTKSIKKTKFPVSTKKATPFVSQTPKKKSGLKCYSCDPSTLICRRIEWTVSECYVGEMCMTYWKYYMSIPTIVRREGCHKTHLMPGCYDTTTINREVEIRCLCNTSFCNNESVPFETDTQKSTKQITTKFVPSTKETEKRKTSEGKNDFSTSTSEPPTDAPAVQVQPNSSVRASTPEGFLVAFLVIFFVVYFV